MSKAIEVLTISTGDYQVCFLSTSVGSALYLLSFYDPFGLITYPFLILCVLKI